jgi:hypothetical protein
MKQLRADLIIAPRCQPVAIAKSAGRQNRHVACLGTSLVWGACLAADRCALSHVRWCNKGVSPASDMRRHTVAPEASTSHRSLTATTTSNVI